MSKTTLQKNLSRLIEQQNYHISELEQKAGLRKNNVYNILKGSSKKPSAQILQAIADVFGITVKDLFSTSIEKIKYLTKPDMVLIEKTVQAVINEVIDLNIEVTSTDFVNIVKEVFDYSSSEQLHEPDTRFLRWTLKQKNFQRKKH